MWGSGGGCPVLTGTVREQYLERRMVMKTLEITLNRLAVTENGSLEKRRDAFLAATLFFPRSGVGQVVSARKIAPLTDQYVLDTALPRPSNGRPYSWAERTLFKEEVLGTAYLVFHVKTGKGAVEKFVEAAVRGLFGAAAGAIASPYVAVLAGTAVSQAFPKDDDDMRVVAAGELEISEHTFGGPMSLSIPLVAPADVIEQGVVVEDNKPLKKHIVLLREGQANGSLAITITPV
jgi:hypothetical protein